MRRGVCRDIYIGLLLIDRRLWPSICIALVCVVCMLLPKAMFGSGYPWWSGFLYHFSHANIFHLLLNLWALFQFKPRWKTCAVGYVASSLAAMIPFAAMAAPTCGLSGFLMAAFARKYAEFRLPIWKPLLVNMVFVFFPMFNWKIHLLSFLIGYVLWYRNRK